MWLQRGIAMLPVARSAAAIEISSSVSRSLRMQTRRRRRRRREGQYQRTHPRSRSPSTTTRVATRLTGWRYCTLFACGFRKATCNAIAAHASGLRLTQGITIPTSSSKCCRCACGALEHFRFAHEAWAWAVSQDSRIRQPQQTLECRGRSKGTSPAFGLDPFGLHTHFHLLTPSFL